MEIDASIGRVMQLLKTHQKDENTLVYFTSDHGSLVDVGLNGGSNGNFKGKICIMAIAGYREHVCMILRTATVYTLMKVFCTFDQKTD